MRRDRASASPGRSPPNGAALHDHLVFFISKACEAAERSTPPATHSKTRAMCKHNTKSTASCRSNKVVVYARAHHLREVNRAVSAYAFPSAYCMNGTRNALDTRRETSR